MKFPIKNARRGYGYWALIFASLLLAKSIGCAAEDPPMPIFDGERAYQHLLAQCKFGPRVPGSPAHRQCLNYLTSALQKTGARVSHQKFTAENPLTGEQTELTNIIASFGLDASERIMLCAHWDTRPWADEDPDPDLHTQPISGANDGASGVAVLLEVARHLSLVPPKVGVDIILFDGEDLGRPGDSDTYALGSQHFAETKDLNYRPKWAILVDMVGDKDLRIYQEENSLSYAPDLVEKIWARAARLELSSFVPMPGYEVTDDHLPLLRAGIPCVDIIDFHYEYWHTIEDTPDKCSPESLAQVGRLIMSLVYDGTE